MGSKQKSRPLLIRARSEGYKRVREGVIHASIALLVVLSGAIVFDMDHNLKHDCSVHDPFVLVTAKIPAKVNDLSGPKSCWSGPQRYAVLFHSIQKHVLNVLVVRTRNGAEILNFDNVPQRNCLGRRAGKWDVVSALVQGVKNHATGIDTDVWSVSRQKNSMRRLREFIGRRGLSQCTVGYIFRSLGLVLSLHGKFVSVVPAFLHLLDHSSSSSGIVLSGPSSNTGSVSLPDAYAAPQYAASSQYSREDHHSSINGKLVVFVLFVALLGVFLLTCKIIQSLGVENRDAVFVMKYWLVIEGIFGGQSCISIWHEAGRLAMRM